MKKFLLTCVLVLSGCSILFPIPHDPVMFDSIVSTKIAVENLKCDNKDWTETQQKIHQLKVYTQLRKDPQAESVAQLEEAIGKAKDTKNPIFCESILKINKTRVDVIIDAWKGR